MIKDAESKIYIGLGSNLDLPIQHIKQALLTLNTLPATNMVTHSSLYRSKPLGSIQQPDYINAVAVLASDLPPLELLEQLHAIEAQHGRTRNDKRWGPRPLDLDLLLYADYYSQDPHLTLPHPGVYQRNFVLCPLYECVPQLILPNGQYLRDLIAHCSSEGLEIIVSN